MEDQKELELRCVSSNDKMYLKTALHLFSTNKDVEEHNDFMLSSLENDKLAKIPAIDVSIDSKTKKSLYRSTPLVRNDISLVAYLTVCPQASVMLTANIDVSDGLTNGALGTVSHLKLKNDKVIGIYVKIDNEDVGKRSRSTKNECATVIR